MKKIKVYPTDKYPSTDVLERYFVLMLFQNENVRKTYLPIILPHIFHNKKIRYVVYVMKKLYEKGDTITSDSVILAMKQPTEEMIAFMKKHYIPKLSESDVYDMAYDPSVISRTDLVDSSYKSLLNAAFNRFVNDAIFDMDEANSNFKHQIVLAKAKGITKVHDIIYGSPLNEGSNQIEKAAEYINRSGEYIPTSINKVNSLIGGFTRGFVDTIGAKSGHTKSSWVDANALDNLLKGVVNKVLVITPEEAAYVRWRRIFSSLCNIPSSALRQKTAKITDEHIKIVKEKLEGKLIFVDNVVKYGDIISLMYETDADIIYIDHLQSIVYPGAGTSLSNMIGNIPGLVNVQKVIAREKNIPIVNLSQVGDKAIQRSDRVVKSPRYWDLYGSSVLYQAARELLMLWYPVKDYDEYGVKVGPAPTKNDVILRVEKSSYTETGTIKVYFDPEYNKFLDEPVKENQKPEMEDLFN